MWYVMWSHIPLSPCSLPLPLVVIHQLIRRKRWPGSPVMWFAIACFLLFTKVLWIETFSVYKCSVLSYLWHENNKTILFSTWYCVSGVIKFYAVLKDNIKRESNWKMKRDYLRALLETLQLGYDVFIRNSSTTGHLRKLYNLRGLRYQTRDCIWFKLK